MTRLYITPNEFQGSDSQRINQAVACANENGLIVVIPRINEHAASGQPRDVWLLDEAITLPSDTVIELHHAHLKLSDRCRDNFFRSANCGMGIEHIEPARNIHIAGKGSSLLEGADHPRATGDSAKTIGQQTCGSDAGNEDESQTGDWRNVGILMANVSNFSIENLTIKDAHCWAISLEYCKHGKVRDIIFDATGSKNINGKQVAMLNQDGLNLRQGCHDIIIENITGHSGDDLIALTAIDHQNKVAGCLNSTMISGQGDESDGIHGVFIRNVRGHSAGGHHIVRFLNTGKLPLYDIVLDGLIDSSGPPYRSRAAVKIGDANEKWGGVNKLGMTSRLQISNINTRSKHPILIAGSLGDSTIANVIMHDSHGDPVVIQSGEQSIANVQLINVRNVTPISPV